MRPFVSLGSSRPRFAWTFQVGCFARGNPCLQRLLPGELLQYPELAPRLSAAHGGARRLHGTPEAAAAENAARAVLAHLSQHYTHW